MDLGTTAAVVGIVAAVVYVAETAHKYISAIFQKKSSLARGRESDTLSKKGSGTTASKKIDWMRSRLDLENGKFIKGSYAHSIKVLPTHDLDITVLHPLL